MLFGILYLRRRTNSRLRVILFTPEEARAHDEKNYRHLGWTKVKDQFFDEKGPDAKFWLGNEDDQSP